MSETEITAEDQEKSLVENSNELAVHFHGLFAAGKGNVIFSPFYLTASMAAVLAEAKARGQDYIHKEVNETVSAFKQQISDLLKTTESFIFMSAFSLLNQTGIALQEQLKSVLTDTFDALIMDLDPETDNSEAIEKINESVDEKTNGMIPKHIELDPNSGLVFLSALYFKGTWLHVFEEAMTSPENFYDKGNEEHTKTVDMMHKKESFLFADKDSFRVLQLLYLGEEIAMLILLPSNMDGLEELEAMITPAFIQDLISDLTEKKVDLALPRLHLEYSQSLDYSKDERIKKLLISGDASEFPEFNCEIKLKVVLDIDEGGSEDATTNGLVEKEHEDCDLEFIVDHPFVFLIYDVNTNLIIFMGRVEEL